MPRQGGQAPGGQAKTSADFDATLKDARNLMNELNKAPSLPHGTTHPNDVTYPIDKPSGSHSSNGHYSRRSKSGLVGHHSHSSHSSSYHQQVPKSPHRSRKAPTGGLGPPSHGHGHRHSASGSRGHGSGGGSARHSSAYGAAPAPNSSGAGTPTSRRSSRRSAAHTSDGTTRPPSILEMPIQDPARDAYYGAAVDPEEKLSPTAASRSSGKKSSRRPSSQRATTANNRRDVFGSMQPRSKGSHAKRTGSGAGEIPVPAAE